MHAIPYVVTYRSGNKGALLCTRPPELSEHVIKVEPCRILMEGEKADKPLPARAPWQAGPMIRALMAQAYAEGLAQRSMLRTDAQRKQSGRSYAARAWLKVEQEPGTIDYTAAAEQLAYSIYGCHIQELSDSEAEDCRRHARTTVNRALGVKP